MSHIGNLCPIMVQEVAPGDTWSGKTGILVRLSPLKRALLQDLYVDQFTFYVPHRLVMADWETFISDGPMDTPNIDIPTVQINSTSGDDMASLFFDKPAAADSYDASQLRMNAYNLIWNEYFRDEQDPIVTPATKPGITGRDISFKKDYWTTLRDNVGLDQSVHFADVTAGSPDQVSALAILEAIARQKIATKRATYGTRYIDILRSYGVNVNYQMLQRPEIVAMARGTINVTDVVQTGGDTSGGAGDDLGTLAGHGIAGTRLTLKRKTFPEHGTLMSCIAVRPVNTDPGYADWFDKPRDYTSFYDPGLVPLPPVRVQKSDVIGATEVADRATLVGFQQWGNWYRSAMSRVHTGLDQWTGSNNLSPTLWDPRELRNINQDGFNALFNDTTYGHYQVSAVHALRALRAIPRVNTAANANP